MSAQRHVLRRWAASALFVLGGGLSLMPPQIAWAQDKPKASKPGWVRDFDEVTVKRIKPDALPDVHEPGAAIGLRRTSSGDLPRIATQEQLEQLSAQIRPNVARIVAVQTPPRPYRQVPMLFFGHAVWVTPAPDSAVDKTTSSPVLLSSLDWLSKAQHVYLIPDDIDLEEGAKSATSNHSKKDMRAQGAWRASRRSLEQMTAGSRGEKWIKKHRSKLIELSPRDPDRLRNLVRMHSEDTRFVGPARGFALFDTAEQALFKLYGFSPYSGDYVSSVMLQGNHPDNPALTFYWQTDYAAILGAPLVAQDGTLVAINTLKHPDEAKVFLAIPTPAIASYLEQYAPSKDAAEEEKKK